MTGRIDFVDKLFLLHTISFEVTACKLNVQCMPINAHQSRRDTVHDNLNKTYSALLMIIYAMGLNLYDRIGQSIGNVASHTLSDYIAHTKALIKSLQRA